LLASEAEAFTAPGRFGRFAHASRFPAIVAQKILRPELLKSWRSR